MRGIDDITCSRCGKTGLSEWQEYNFHQDCEMKPKETEVSPREFWIGFSGDPAKDKRRCMRTVSGESFEPFDFNDEIVHVREVTASQPSDLERLRIAVDALNEITRFPLADGIRMHNIAGAAAEAIGPLDGSSK